VGTSIRTAVLIAALLVVSTAAPAMGQDGRTVREILFQGNRGDLSQSTLKYTIGTKEGQPLSDSQLAEDVSTLLTYFARVSVETENLADGVRLTFIVEELPTVTSVVFRGFSALDSKELHAAVDTKEGFPFARFKVERDRLLLTDMLKRKGHYFAEIKVAAGEYARGKQVVFTGVEGPEVEVDEIHFIGNTAFDGDDLRDRMVLDESGFLSSTAFVQRTLDQDLISVVSFYRSEGYLDAVVDLRELAFSEDKEKVTITVDVSEGEPYLVKEVLIRGGEKFPSDRAILENRLQLEPGNPRRDLDMLATRSALRDYYLENSYYNARVELGAEDDSFAHTSTIIFTITEGDPVQIGRVDIAGNALTRDEVIRRNLTVRPGGPLNSIELQKSINRLNGLGYFEAGSVTAQVLDTDVPGVKDLRLDLKEGRTGSVKFSAGISSDLGILGVFELTKQNFDYADLPKHWGDAIAGQAFTGAGQTLNLMLSPGSDYSQYRLAFTEPWAFGEYVFAGPSGDIEESPFSLGFDAYHTLFSRFAYDERRTGLSVGTGKVWRKHGLRVDDILRANVDLVVENVRLKEIDDDAASNAFAWEGMSRLQKIGLGFGWTAVDLPVAPGNGWDIRVNYTLSGGFLGGEVDFHKALLRVTNYHTLYTTKIGQRHILELSGRIGIAKEFSNTDDLPIFERFFAGGLSTVRGFKYGEVGPRSSGDPATPEGQDLIERSKEDGDGDPMGGRTIVLLRGEYGFPLYDQFLRGVTFVDTGNVTEHWSRDILDTYRVAVGVGIRIRVPFLGPTPIALDFAWPVRQERGDDTQVFSFTFDQPF
jgi:outer membrane protein insertion porin family